MTTTHSNKRMRLLGVLCSLILICSVSFLLVSILKLKSSAGPAQASASSRPNPVEPAELAPTPRILHIMSYHTPWKWTDDQFDGFQAALKGIHADYKIIQMDTKRHSREDWKRQISQEAKDVIQSWRPDLVFTGDDNAQRYVAADFVNSGIPFVFCAVNADPSEYGFVGSSNVTGVLERMHYTATLRLLKQLCPQVKKAVVLTDNGKMWPGMIERMKKQVASFPDIRIVRYETLDTFEQFKQTVLNCQDEVDALGLLGVFEFRDADNNNVPMEKVLLWLRDNNRLPDFSFWKDRVNKGTLCAVGVSGYAQGYEAGLLARQILLENRSPSSLPMKSTETGIALINLETARRLGIRPDAQTLLTADVVRETELK